MYGHVFNDWASSDRVLTDLEERIDAWHASDQDDTSKYNKGKAVKMRRVSIEVSVHLLSIIFQQKFIEDLGHVLLISTHQLSGPKLV